MIIKTIALGLISAAAAGSVMYFGTLPDDDATGEAEPITISGEKNAAIDQREALPKSMTATIKANPDLQVVMYDTDDQAEAEAGAPKSAPKPKKRWLDQYLKSEPSHDDGEIETVETDAGSDSATGRYVVEADSADENDAAAENTKAETSKTESTEAQIINNIVRATESDPTPRYFKIEDGMMVKIDPEDIAALGDDGPSDRMESSKPMNDREPSSSRYQDRLFKTVMTEAANIKKPELRDQAYFEIVEYGLSQGDFTGAQDALDKIEQVDMNYTAKSRIAVAFAQKDMADMAFETINSVDEPELRDFMRLQVIEALIAPQKLPEAWQDRPAPPRSN